MDKRKAYKEKFDEIIRQKTHLLNYSKLQDLSDQVLSDAESYAAVRYAVDLASANPVALDYFLKTYGMDQQYVVAQKDVPLSATGNQFVMAGGKFTALRFAQRFMFWKDAKEAYDGLSEDTRSKCRIIKIDLAH